MTTGWFKLHRELINKPIWKCSSSEHKIILITILCMVNHEENEWVFEGKKYKCKPGQMITSLKSIAESSGTSKQNVRTALNNFQKKYEFLTYKSTKTGRLVTVLNWELYQSNEKNQHTSQHRTNIGLTPNKNDKNDKNIKTIYSEFVSMTEAEYQKLVDKYGQANTQKMIDLLNNYKGANGKKYKSDYLAILNWVAGKVVIPEQVIPYRKA